MATMKRSAATVAVVATIFLAITTVSAEVDTGSVRKGKDASDSISSRILSIFRGLEIQTDQCAPQGPPSFYDTTEEVVFPDDLDEPLDEEEFDYPGDVPERPAHSVRFSKVFFRDPYQAAQNAKYLPLGPYDYPLTKQTQAWLRDSECWSVFTQDDVHQRMQSFPTGVPELLDSIGESAGPSHPEDKEYWKEFEYVMKMQQLRTECGDTMKASSVWDVPNTWKDVTLSEAADLVHDEYPAYHQAELITTLFATGKYGFAGLKHPITVDYDIIPFPSNVPFVHGPVMLADFNTWAVSLVGNYNFPCKWMYGRARPEETAWLIKSGQMTSGVPDYIHREIAGMDFHDAPSYTAYKEGCPTHPSWPAMHSAASSLSLWMCVVLNCSDYLREEIRKVDYAVSYSRTVAGVHYVSDNIVGLKLGQAVIAKALPEYLNMMYGSDPFKVRAKIQKEIFDWDWYDHSKYTDLPTCGGCCSFDGVSCGDHGDHEFCGLSQYNCGLCYGRWID